jgi:hypothetical protein
MSGAVPCPPSSANSSISDMDDLMHKLVSTVLVAVLLAGVSALSVANRRRKAARDDATAPAPSSNDGPSSHA